MDLIRSVLESLVPDTSNGGSNVESRLIAADLTTFELVAKLMKIWQHGDFESSPGSTSDPSMDAPGLVLSSARNFIWDPSGFSWSF